MTTKQIIDEIVNNCRLIAIKHGKMIYDDKPRLFSQGIVNSNSKEYKDEYIWIISSVSSPALFVEILSPFSSSQYNPAIMIKEDGEFLRWHGEMFNARHYLKILLLSVLP